MIGEIVNSRYQVVRKLRDERWGGAWLAEDTLGGGTIVLHVVKGDLAGADRVQHLRHAFRVRASVSHPVLAQAIDSGAVVGTADSFFTHEHVEGKDLLEASADWTAEQACDAAAQALHATACLHAKGVFRLDARTEAFRVAGGALRWMDVGIDPGEGAVEGVPIAFSAAYTAPEVMRGGPEDPRSDLWTAGLMLYHLLARRLPFDEDGLALLRRIASDAPPPPSKHRPGLPDSIDSFVMRLLAREPSARPASANEAIRELSRAAGKEYEEESIAAPDLDDLPCACPGAEEVVAKARGMAEAVLFGTSGGKPLLLVSGAAGSGKSRVLAELALSARLSGAAVALGECREGAAPPLGPFEAALRAFEAPPPRDAGRDPLLPASDLEATLGPRSERDRIRLAHRIACTLIDRSRERPLLVAVEDLQWADGATVALLAHIARVLALARQEAGGAGPLRGHPRAGAGPRLFVVASSRTAVEGIEEGLCERLALPSVEGGPSAEPSRLRRLGRTERHVLDLLSTAHAEVSLGLLAQVSGLERDAVLDLLASLRRRGLVERRGGAEGYAYRVARHSTREAAYGELDPKRRAALHRVVAAGIEATSAGGVPGPEGTPGPAGREHELAEHFRQGGQAEKAAVACVSAARRAAAQGNAARAREHLKHATSLAPEWRTREELADVEEQSGAAAAALEHLDLVLQDSSLPPADRVRVLRKRAEIHLGRGEVEEAFTDASDAHAKLDAVEGFDGRAAVVAVLAAALVRRGEHDAAISGVRKMMERAPKGPAGAGETLLRTTLSAAQRAKGDLERAVAELERCMPGARKRGDEGASLMRLLAALAEVHETSGNSLRALQCWTEALELAGRALDLPAMWMLHVRLVGSHARRGAADLARVHLAQAERLATQMGSAEAFARAKLALECEAAAAPAVRPREAPVEPSETPPLPAEDRAGFLELLRVMRDLTRERDLEALLRSITDNVVRLFRADRATLMLLEDGQLRGKVARDAAGSGAAASGSETQDAAGGNAAVVSSAAAERALKEAAPIVVAAPGPEGAERTIACLPLSVHERVLGVLCLVASGRSLSAEDVEVMTAFASGAAIAIENANLYSQVIEDDFTGLKSHRYFMLRLHEEVRRATRLGRPVALVHLDIDRLKLVNDIHGPEGGNTVVRGVARVLLDLLRHDDTVRVAPTRAGGEKVAARIEGGKFELLLPDTDAGGAAGVAERVLERVRAIAFAMGPSTDAAKGQVTASAGIASFPGDARDAEGLALKAGEALYTAKRNGRDRVFAYGADGRRDDAEVKGRITDPDFDALALSRDGRTFMGMVSRILDIGLDLEKILEVALKLAVDVTGAQRGVILLKEPGGFLRPRRTLGISAEELEKEQHALSFSLVRQVAKEGKPMLVPATALDEKYKDQASVMELSLQSILCAPIEFQGELIGVFYLDTSAIDREFTKEHEALLMAFAHKLANPLQASRLHEWHAEETRMLRRALDELGTQYRYDNIVGTSKPMQELFRLLDKVTPSQFPVLIHGESGTGKELVARAIHFNGPRKSKPFVAENCAALPETLLESELFGHVKGSFTGADRDKKGLFELANGGTLFLDEVGDMGHEMQKTLLRAIQEGEVRPIGGKTSVKVDVRVITATHRRLEEMVKEGKFRQDLFYRLNVIPIAIPPLRERRDDIPYLVHHFLERHAKGTPHPERKIERGAMEALVRYDWPGNVRELENEIKKLVAMGGEVITQASLSPSMRRDGSPAKEKHATRVSKRIAPRSTLEDIEKDAILQSLKENKWSIRRTASVLGMERMALARRIRKLKIVIPKEETKRE